VKTSGQGCNKIYASKLQVLESNDDIWCILELFAVKPEEILDSWPSEIKQLVEEFADIFDKPKGLPSYSNCDLTDIVLLRKMK